MPACRISSISPTCAYADAGIASVRLLDLDDFGGFRFQGDAGFESCDISVILRSGAYVFFDTRNHSARYTGDFQGEEHAHTLEFFLPELSAEVFSRLYLAAKRRYLVIYESKGGEFHAFGHDTGAMLRHTGQTDEGAGVMLTLTATSRFPLFAVEHPDIAFGDFSADFSHDFFVFTRN